MPTDPTHDIAEYVKPRCRWCGCFVAADAEPTTRTVRGIAGGILAWRTFTQMLCQTCAACWATDSPWNRAAA